MNGTANNFMAGSLGIGHTILPTSAWSSPIVVGISGQNKIIAGYLASTVLGATIGANNSALTAWADLNIAGSAIIFRSGGENDRGRIFSNGNFTYGGNVDSGYKFDVVGTFRTSTTSYLCTNSGNALIGSTTDSGEKLQVTGTAKITGATVIETSLGFGTDSLRATIFAGSGSNRGIVLQDNAAGIANVITFTVGNVTKTNGGKPDILLNSSYTQPGIFQGYNKLQLTGTYTELSGGTETRAIFIDTTIGATTNYRAIEWTNNNGWGLYGAGTAKNYLNGNLGLGVTTNNASAKFQVDSTTQGILPPRMTTTQKNAIATPAAGLIVYDSTTNKLCCYNGTTWNDLF
jgi:hypothetical protein